MTLPIELIQSVVFQIPNEIRARIALRCDFPKFMEYVNKAANNTYRFKDITFINRFSITGFTPTETRNVFQFVVNYVGPKVGHTSVVLQRNSFQNEKCVESSMIKETSISPSKTLRDPVITSIETTSVCVKPGNKFKEME